MEWIHKSLLEQTAVVFLGRFVSRKNNLTQPQFFP